MLEVHINPILDFRDHLKHITIDIRKLAKALTKRLLSPNRKKLVIEQVLKSKYHATHLGIFTDKPLTQIDKIFNIVVRNTLGLTPSFPTEAIHKPTKEIGLGYAPMKDRATQMGIEQISEIINKPTDRGYMAYAHTTKVANTYYHWPKEAHEATTNPTRIIVHKEHTRGGIRTHTTHTKTKPNSNNHPCGHGGRR